MDQQIDEAVKLLHKNWIKTVKDWKELTEGQKDKDGYPSGIRIILDQFSNITLKNIKDCNNFLKKFITISSLKQVQEETKEKFDFIEREEGRKIIESCALNNLKCYEKAIHQKTKTQDVGFVIFSGGSGSGKTRATKEIIKMLKDMSKEYPLFQNTCSIYFDFKNGDGLQSFEIDPNQIAGLRTFSHGLCLSSVNGLPEELKKRIEELHKLKAFEVSNILGLIGETYHQLLDRNDLIPLIIIMDEMQLTIEQFSLPKKYKEISKSLGHYCYSQFGKNENLLKDKLIVIPVIAGTDKDLGFPLTEFNNYQYPLPPFSKEGIFKIMKQLNIDEFWYNTKEKTRFWELNGMIPRCLEFGIDVIEQINSKEFKSEELLFSKIEEMIFEKYGKLETCYEKQLLYLCFTGRSISPFLSSGWYNELYLKGIIYQDPKSDRLLLPYPYFQNILEYQKSGIPSNILPKLTSQFNWILFEQLINYILFHTMIGKKEIENQTNIKVEELFNGAYISEPIKKIMIHISIPGITNDKDSFLKGTKNNFHLNYWNKIEKMTLISKCKDNTLLVDSTITDETNKIILIIQKKLNQV